MANISISNAAVTVTIAPLGAEMQSIVTADGKSWLWHGDTGFWSGRAPVLFPIVGKAPGDMVGIGGKDYAMGQHGFARRSVFALEAATADAARFVLQSSDATKTVYPFEFTLTLAYGLVDAGVSVTSTVTNLDNTPLPFQLGYHPAFAWPLPGAENQTHEMRLAGDAEPKLARLRNGLLTGQRQPSPFNRGRLLLDHALFAEDAMIFPEGTGNSIGYGVEGGAKIELSWDGLPNLALWSKPGAPFICIEPWHGMAAKDGGGNALLARPYALSLEPGESRAFSYVANFHAG